MIKPYQREAFEPCLGRNLQVIKKGAINGIVDNALDSHLALVVP